MNAAKQLDENCKITRTLEESVHTTLKQISGKNPIISNHYNVTNFSKSADISGIIPLKDEAACDYLIVNFDEKSAANFATQILGIPCTEIDSTVSSCVAELCNMAYGQFKTKMNQQGHKYQMAIPVTKDHYLPLNSSNEIKFAIGYKITLEGANFELIVVFCD